MDKEQGEELDVLGSSPGGDLDLSQLTADERAVAAKILRALADKANRQAEANKARELESVVTKITEDNKTAIQAHLEKLTKSMTPPTPEELQAVLSQEYAEFTVHVGRGEGKRTFTICELPLAVETKVFKIIQRTLSARLEEISRIQWDGSTTMLQRVEKILEVVPGAVETLSDAVAACLDPWNDDTAITGEWVRKNVGLTRLTEIVYAQVQASRYRDFLSLAGRFTKG